MLRWLLRGRKDDGPFYSLLRAIPCRGLPPDLAEREASSDYQQWRDRIEADLAAQPVDDDAPSFLTFLKAGNGLLQLRLDDQKGGCLLAFSSPLRASDYASEAAREQSFEYFCSSAKEVVLVIQHLVEYAGVTHVALDRCPRCNVFSTIHAASLNSAAKVIQVWQIAKASQLARSGLYWDYARSAARNGDFLCARDVALELVGHVTAEDLRCHLLLGKIAIQLKDKKLLGEAKKFLAFTRQHWAVEELESSEKTRVLEF